LAGTGEQMEKVGDLVLAAVGMDLNTLGMRLCLRRFDQALGLLRRRLLLLIGPIIALDLSTCPCLNRGDNAMRT
jgi:hypothetical protein